MIQVSGVPLVLANNLIRPADVSVAKVVPDGGVPFKFRIPLLVIDPRDTVDADELLSIALHGTADKRATGNVPLVNKDAE